ncbi:LHR1 SKI2 family RNA SFII helicase [Cryptosporidium ubiquitum]|uniref:LHR1 SKI2 family RNA SFII helicase n=1 Tax=Cryptosporidium ubiquitum TaxID=857276 RepID=A0A1J4MRL4_9CRYT|nr:LHR1 SKI2 family RNA SFII helicase [Cryptosporidium ubiquitum]OII75533.1 LHR1 SKI2 family RNA SFII helicase [Cryptosporidium ubiquitum]
MLKRERTNELVNQRNKLSTYQAQILTNIRLLEFLKKILETYNKLISNNYITRISSILCGVSSDCICKLGKCPGIHGTDSINDFKDVIIAIKDKIIIKRITDTPVPISNTKLDLNEILANSRDYIIEFKVEDKCVEDRIKVKELDTQSSTNLIRSKKLGKKYMDSLLKFFEDQILMNIGVKKEKNDNKLTDKVDIEVKENNLEDFRIKRINQLISLAKEKNQIIGSDEVIETISKSTILKGGIVSQKTENAREAKYCDENDEIYSILDQKILNMLSSYINNNSSDKFRFYNHQSEAIKAILKDKKNVIITTGTSSGKSMCYILPCIQFAIQNPKYLTLLIFPTKALSEDQFMKITKIINCFKPESGDILPVINKLDGDTNMNQRREILLKSNIISTNIDFIHWNIEFLSCMIYNRLKLLVIDEAHIYTGHFGINTSYILKRLNRGILYYKQKNKLIIPEHCTQYIVCTATINNPIEHFRNLVGSEFESLNDISLIDNDSSSKEESSILIWDSNKYINKDNTKSYNQIKINKSYKECINMLIEFYYLNRKLILFCHSRKLVENIKRDLLMVLKKINIHNNHHFNFENDIQIYRGGISQVERRKLESLIFNGKVKIVISTIALELGIDVKCFDSVIVFGYPGSINRLTQQFGRCGRDHKTKSIKMLMLNENNEIDNYISNHGKELLSKQFDSCVINLKNPYLLILHLICLTVESFKYINVKRDSKILDLNSEILVDIVKFLYNRNLLVNYDNSKVQDFNTCDLYYNWNKIKNQVEVGIEPACISSLLSLYFENNDQLILNDPKDIYKQIDVRDSDLTISLYNVKDNRIVIDTLPILSSIRLVYPESIYSINGVLFKTLSVDLASRRGLMQEIKKGDHRLKQKTVSSGEIAVIMQGNGERYTLNENSKNEMIKMSIYITGARVTFDIYSYSVYEIINNEWIFLEEKYIQKPLVYSFNTMGMQIKLELRDKFEVEIINIAIHGIIHNVINSLPKYISCNINDISCECPDIKIFNQKNKQTDSIILLLYENKKGGNGYFNELMKLKCTENGKEVRIIEDIIHNMRYNLNSCNCKNGCLNCGFLLYSCIKNNRHINKQITLEILENIEKIRNNTT